MNENKIVHRDLRLENILIGENYIAKLSNFAFGRVIDEGIMSTYTGSISTMAPEIRPGGNYDEKCDIWSLGLLLYQIVFGELPFSSIAQSRGDVLKLVSNPDWLVFPKAPPVSDALKALISKMLISDPKDRIGYKELFDHPWITAMPQHSRNIDLEESKHLESSTKTSNNDFWYTESPENGNVYEDEKLRLFEEFFIIGVGKTELEHAEKLNPLAKLFQLPPKILFNFPSDSKALKPPKSNVFEYCTQNDILVELDEIYDPNDLFL